ncbi:hypothetical protein RHGRI_012048 [Rhododendron griersonianum]|uniref:L-arabinokinase n=1 Tax=Rhododendron griersonianum TaxID=479676 RepID=A0AAV6KPF3_9ERIC|nr:hypothetical protein RHGRI_012048 [Rhododendron griersonianum]
MGTEEGNEQVLASRKHLVFAYYVTGHGFGHATRVVEVVRHLIYAGHDVHVVTGAPDFVFTTEIQSPKLFLRKLVLDCGAVQADALTVDRLASLEKYSETAVVPRASILATEVEWLNSIKADLVVSDVVPVACRAAADAGIRSVCVTNFSWDFIYAEYVMAAGHHHRTTVWQIAEDYSHCEFLIRLPGYCPMPAFRDVMDVPLVVRRLHKSRKELIDDSKEEQRVIWKLKSNDGTLKLTKYNHYVSLISWILQNGPTKRDNEVRKELGIGDDVKVVILNFGGQPGGWNLKEDCLPSGWLCLVCGASDDQNLPSNFIKLAKAAYTPDLIAASDCMLGKIGYGTVSEALAYKLPFVFVRRDYFNEEPFLRNMLEYYQGGVEMIRRDLLTGRWKPYLERAISLKPCYEGGINGGEVAARILQDTAVGKNYTADKLSGARRLRDAIVLGYQLQRVPGRDICIPDWYANAENEFGLRTGSPTAEMTETRSHIMSYTEDFDILHGDLQGLSDTMTFLKSLAELDAVYDSGKNKEKHWIRERMAAAGIFNWEEEIFVARAPGRLDVVGGIADYSGSLVLQMPIREACHVAVQTNHPSKHKLWKHTQARQNAKRQGPTPVLQIVSYGSELSNRGPTFDMDLTDFMDGGQPISFQKAKEYFARDPSQRWAAYVAGAILVLMTELGMRFENSISMLVSSAVPEGKGVSSSASVEVASMSAIAAAHGSYDNMKSFELGGHFHSKIEGLDISPRELALLCQKVENHIVGAPCGVMDQMASACGEANKLLAMICQPAEVIGLVDIPNHIRFWGIDSGIRHRYAALYFKMLPDSILGEAFLDQYSDHSDPVTIIDKKRTYGVRAAARHPIYETFRVKVCNSMLGTFFDGWLGPLNLHRGSYCSIYPCSLEKSAFKALLTSAASDEQLTALGELLYQCHYSYSACGLGSDGTDRLVQLVQQMQHKKKSNTEDGTLYGAKITGGGSGGTVCVIGRNCLRSSQQILEIQQRYKGATGYMPFLFEGSSPGAGKFGYLRIRRRHPPNFN